MAATPDDPATGARAALGTALFVALIHLSPAVGLAPGALGDDLGIQYFLGRQTAAGAIPLVDFEHTWNVLSWYFNAALHLAVGSDPSAWLYLWGRVFGPALAAVTAIGVLWRLRLRAEWILVGAGSWLALSHVIHSKYTIPILWVFVLVPTGRRHPAWRGVFARGLLTGLTILSQVELAVLLGAGVMLFDLIGHQRPWRDRLTLAAAVPAGALLALAGELAVFALIGQPPNEILRQLFVNAAETAPGFNYDYPVFSAVSLRPKLFPASLLLAFVPVVWQRISSPTRLVACLHLTQALIAIRRPDPAHVDAATTLLGLLAVLVAYDLVTNPRHRGRWWPIATTPATVRAGLATAAVFVVAVAGAFWIDSLAAIVVPTVLLAAMAVVADRRGDLVPAMTIGAMAVTAALLIGSVAGGIVTAIRGGDALAPTTALAEELQPALERCTGPDRQAWIVPGPLSLYTEAEITNPTSWTVFWYGFGAEHDRVRQAIADNKLPAIIQVGDDWPDSFGSLPQDIAAAFRPCARLATTAVGQPVTVWQRRQQ